MSIQELLGWAQSIISSMGLSEVVKAAFVIILAVTVLSRFVGKRD